MNDAVGKALTPEEQFRDNIRQRILETAAIGDLMPQAVFDKLIEAAVKEALLAPRKELRSGASGRYSDDFIAKESWLCEQVRPIVEAQLTPLVNKYFEDHRDEILAHIKSKLDRDLGETFFRAIFSLFEAPFRQLQEGLEQRLHSLTIRPPGY